MVDVPGVVAPPAEEPAVVARPSRRPLAQLLADCERTVAVAIGIVTLIGTENALRTVVARYGVAGDSAPVVNDLVGQLYFNVPPP